MAKGTEEVIINTDLRITRGEIRAIADMVKGADGLNDSQKVTGVAMTCLHEVATGGVLITAEEMNQIKETTGVDFNGGLDLIPLLSESQGVEDGCKIFKVRMDPAYYDACVEIAQVRGWSVEQTFQEAVDNAFFQGWLEAIPESRVPMVVMSGRDKENLEEMLGGSFGTGTDLVRLIKSALGMDGLVAEQVAASNIGRV